MFELLVVVQLQWKIVGAGKAQTEQSFGHIKFLVRVFIEEDQTLDMVIVLGQGQELNLLVHAHGLQPGQTVCIDGHAS